MKINLKEYLIDKDMTLRDALEFINRYGHGFIVAVDKGNKLIGVATDGDLRRAILKKPLNTPIIDVCNKNPVTVSPNIADYEVLNLFSTKIKFLPVADKNRKIISIITPDSIEFQKTESKEIYRCSVPLRVSFSGGGTDIGQYYNSTAGFVLSTTINLYCHGTIKKRKDKKIVIHSDLLKTPLSLNAKSMHYDGKMDLVKAVIKLLRPVSGFDR